MPHFLPLFIGLRYTRSKRSEGFFSFVSGFSFLAMALGVMALIVVLSVMNGFDREIKTRLLNIIPHITLGSDTENIDWQNLKSGLEGIPGIEGITAYVEGQGMLSYGKALEGVSIQGIDPDDSGIVHTLEDHMLAGTTAALKPGEYGVIIGNLLARSLNVMTGDSLMLSLPELTVTPVGVFPRVKRLRVTGIFQVGAQVDSGIAFLHIQDAARLLRLGARIHGLRLSLDDPFKLRKVVSKIRQKLPVTVRISTWEQAMQPLFQAIRMEKTVVGLLLTVIIGVAAFNIVASLVLMVADKRKDMAVLRTLGATGSTIAAIFRVQGSIVGVSGVFVGVVVGSVVAHWIGNIVATIESLFGFHIFDPGLYFISSLPSELQALDVLIIASVATLVSLLATVYPARRAGRILPAEVLRYDH